MPIVLPTIYQRCFTIFKEFPFKILENLGNITNRNWTHILITPQEIDTPTRLRGLPPPPPVSFLFTTWPRKLSITRVTWFRFPPPHTPPPPCTPSDPRSNGPHPLQLQLTVPAGRILRSPYPLSSLRSISSQHLHQVYEIIIRTLAIVNSPFDSSVVTRLP